MSEQWFLPYKTPGFKDHGPYAEQWTKRGLKLVRVLTPDLVRGRMQKGGLST